MPNKKHRLPFPESEWLKLLFLLAESEQMLNDLHKQLFDQLPVSKKRFIRKRYYLTVAVLAHIMERHYYKIERYPGASKFHIPVADILNHIRQGYALTPVPAGDNFQRTIEAESPVGYDRSGNETNVVTILTDGGGKIITAFPGRNE